MSILIGKHIQEVLSQEETIVEKVGERIYPLIIAHGVDRFPYIVFENMGISETDSKDGVVNDVVSVGISVVAKSYGEAVLMAHQIRYILEDRRARYPEFEVQDCKMGSYSEDYAEGLEACVSTLNMEFTTVDY